MFLRFFVGIFRSLFVFLLSLVVQGMLLRGFGCFKVCFCFLMLLALGVLRGFFKRGFGALGFSVWAWGVAFTGG